MTDNQNLQSTQVIAKIFGVSTRRVEQLKTEGIIKGQGKPTKYDLLPTIQSYISYLSEKANGREKKESVKQLEKKKLEAEVALKKSKADMAELELKELQGEMHRSEDVEAVMTDHILLIRSMILALPSRLAVDVFNAKTAADASEIIKTECYAMLNQLSAYEYNPEEYQRRVRERQGWEVRMEEAVVDE